jgi:D-glycero-alpha-D-manno-heptose-7-phosphate kinase
MDAEMSARRTLSPTVMTEATERLFAAARGAGALAAKVCGAGGGGCSVYWCRAGARLRVAEAIVAAGGTILEFHASPAGALSGAPSP